MHSSSRALRPARVITAAALICLFLVHFFAVYARRHRVLDYDEAQYLHVGWLMAQGKHLYRDFAEDHAPFLFVILESLVPATGTELMPRLDVLSYVARARAVTSAFGAMALACVALLTYGATRNLLAPLITTATLLGSDWFWHRGITDTRNDPPALFLFWLGALLLTTQWHRERKRHVLAGAGIGLAVAAALWSPKMPFECVVLGAIYLGRLKEASRGGLHTVVMTIVPAVAITGAAVLFIGATVSLPDYLFFTFRYNVIIAGFSSHFFSTLRFLYCDPAFKGIWPLLALATMAGILLVPRIRRQVRDLNLRASAIVFALAIAAILDIRFVFPYPNLWAQYYFMWDVAIAALYGLTSVAVLRSFGKLRLEAVVQITISVLAVAVVAQALLSSPGEPSWHTISYMQKRLRPYETVWLSPEVHPIAVYDASYYWFAFGDLMPASLQYTAGHAGLSPLPNVRQEDLPTCRAERGLEPNLRFVSGSAALASLPIAQRCLDRIIASGRAVRLPTRDVWDLHPAATAR